MADIDVIRGIYDAFARGDIPAVLAVFDAEIDWRHPPSHPYEDQVGPQAIGENLFRRLGREVEGLAMSWRSSSTGAM